MALQAAFVIGVYLAREYLCQEEQFCSRENGECLRMWLSEWILIPSLIILIGLVGLLIEDSYGWGNVMERIRSVITILTQDNANEVIELGDMNQPNQQIAPDQDVTVFTQKSAQNKYFVIIDNVEGPGDTSSYADRSCSSLCLNDLNGHLQLV